MGAQLWSLYSSRRFMGGVQVLVAYLFNPCFRFWKDMFTRSPVVNFKEYVLGTNSSLSVLDWRLWMMTRDE